MYLQYTFWYHNINSAGAYSCIKCVQYVIKVHPAPLKKKQKESHNESVSLEMLPQQL